MSTRLIVEYTKGERHVPKGIPNLTQDEIERDLERASAALAASNGWSWLLDSEGPYDVETVRAAVSKRFRREISDDAVRGWFHKLPASARESGWGAKMGLWAKRSGLIVFFYHRLGGDGELLDDEESAAS
jgi:hypothetical protein